MPSFVSATPGTTIDCNVPPRSPCASHDAFVLAEDEALVPEVARWGESVLLASLVALHQRRAGRDKRRAEQAAGKRWDKRRTERGEGTPSSRQNEGTSDKQKVGRSASGAGRGVKR